MLKLLNRFWHGQNQLVNPEEQIELYQKAVDLVRGPFLEDIYADWVMLEREHLNQIYLSALLTLAELIPETGPAGEGACRLSTCLDYDPAFEAAYPLSMQIYHRLGDRTSIIRTYQACQDALQRQLGMPPSKETEQLYRA